MPDRTAVVALAVEGVIALALAIVFAVALLRDRAKAQRRREERLLDGIARADALAAADDRPLELGDRVAAPPGRRPSTPAWLNPPYGTPPFEPLPRPVGAARDPAEKSCWAVPLPAAPPPGIVVYRVLAPPKLPAGDVHLHQWQLGDRYLPGGPVWYCGGCAALIAGLALDNSEVVLGLVVGGFATSAVTTSLH